MLDFANAYGSRRHNLIHFAMEWYHLSPWLCKLIKRTRILANNESPTEKAQQFYIAHFKTSAYGVGDTFSIKNGYC